MNETNSEPWSRRKAAFGIVAIFCLCDAACFYLRGVAVLQDSISSWAVLMGVTQGKGGDWWTNSFGGVFYIMFGGMILWVLGLAFAVTGLVRAEKPRWPAIVALVLCMLPLALLLFS